MKKKTWEEFGKSGMLWACNHILHMFGWVIVLSYDDETEKLLEVYPARTNWLGFDDGDTLRDTFLANLTPIATAMGFDKPVITDPAELPAEDQKLVAKLETLG